MSYPEPTIRAAPAIALAKYFDDHKLDFKRVAEASGFPLEALSDPMGTVPLRVIAHLFRAATQVVGDCGFPIKLAEETSVGSTGLFGHLVMSAPSVRAFLECVAGYMPILVTGYEVGYEEKGGTGVLFWRAPVPFDAPTKPIGLYVVATLVLRIRLAVGERWMPLAVSFDHKAPAATSREMEIFGSRVTFDAEMTSITVDAATLGRVMPTANEQMFAIFKHHAALLLREISTQQDLASQVRAAIALRLTRETATLEAVAQDVGVSSRALQRRLERLGLSFEKMLDETRFALAERLLRETDRPLIQVAHEVGYGSQSTFTRAVRRWLDESLRAYRERCRRMAPLNRCEESMVGAHVSVVE